MRGSFVEKREQACECSEDKTYCPIALNAGTSIIEKHTSKSSINAAVIVINYCSEEMQMSPSKNRLGKQKILNEDHFLQKLPCFP